MTLLVALLSVAHAGKLTEGFRGIPFGDAAVLNKAPIEGCVDGRSATDPQDIRWICNTKVGDVPVTVAMMVHGGIFYCYMIHVTGQAESRRLLAALGQAYGNPVKPPSKDDEALGDRVWMDVNVGANWNYNQVSGEGMLTVADMALNEKVEAAKKAEVNKAVGDL